MIDITNPKDCCGCSACYNACNHNAIMMSPDELGFLYPIVDFSKCVDCGLCESVCSFNDNYCKCENLTNAEFYAMRHKILKSLMQVKVELHSSLVRLHIRHWWRNIWSWI
jgi:formate hydrogenlyase subunit 6/NADH:ubiquinone oxidoreductase subunit I